MITYLKSRVSAWLQCAADGAESGLIDRVNKLVHLIDGIVALTLAWGLGTAEPEIKRNPRALISNAM